MSRNVLCHSDTEFGIPQSLGTENHTQVPQMHFGWRQTYSGMEIWGNHKLRKGGGLIRISYQASAVQGAQCQTSSSEEREL